MGIFPYKIPTILNWGIQNFSCETQKQTWKQTDKQIKE